MSPLHELPHTRFQTNSLEPISPFDSNVFENLYVSYILYEPDTKSCCENFFELSAAVSNILSADAIQSFYAALASFRVYRETRDRTWIDRGRVRKADIELWSGQGCAWNFEQKVQLLGAEEQYCDGNFEQAKLLYASAIASAKQHKYVNEEALAYECAARFYMEIGDNSTSLQHFIMAHETYEAWGAVEKARRMFEYVNEKFGYIMITPLSNDEAQSGQKIAPTLSSQIASG